jgi:hypothetical protein
MLVPEIVKLSASFGAHKVRKCTLDEVAYGSVLDAISAVSDSPTQTWSRFKKAHPELLTGIRYHQFPGERARPTPIARGELIIEIILKLPGEAAREFATTAARAFVQALSPSREYISELQERADNNEVNGSSLTLIESSVFDTECAGGTFTLLPGCYGETTLYVRMRLPDEYLSRSDFDKQLTMAILKFGLTYSLHARNGQYARDRDNGYMAFSFHCSSRKEASIIEEILKHDFSSATVLGSREYIDVTAASAILECEFISGSYESYASVAERLYTYMVRRIHMLWPRTAHLYGNSYDIVSNNATLVRSMEDASLRIHSELSFRCNAIDEARAVDMGLIDKPCPAAVTAVETVAPAAAPPGASQQTLGHAVASVLVQSAPVPRSDVHPMTQRMLERVVDRGDVVDEVAIAEIAPSSEELEAGALDKAAVLRDQHDRFVEEMCVVDPNAFVTSAEIVGQYRIWSRETGDGTFSKAKAYFGTRFLATRLRAGGGGARPHGYKGVSLKPAAEYVLPATPTLREVFLFEMCDRDATLKANRVELRKVYKQWTLERSAIVATTAQLALLDTYLDRNFLLAKSTYKKEPGCKQLGGKGYWGIGLKADLLVSRRPSPLARPVQQIDAETGQAVGEPWSSISGAAEAVDWSDTTMKRAIERGTVNCGYKYVFCVSTEPS